MDIFSFGSVRYRIEPDDRNYTLPPALETKLSSDIVDGDITFCISIITAYCTRILSVKISSFQGVIIMASEYCSSKFPEKL